MHTKDKLADELMKLGLMDISLKARAGWYHDFLSPLDMPETQLVNDLAAAANGPPRSPAGYLRIALSGDQRRLRCEPERER